LTAKFGRSSVFMDVDDFARWAALRRGTGQGFGRLRLVLAIIGRRWMELLRTKTSSDDRDYVREEIAEALRRKIVVIPGETRRRTRAGG